MSKAGAGKNGQSEKSLAAKEAALLRGAKTAASNNRSRSKAGRPPLYDPRLLPLVKAMVNRGAKRSHIAELLGVTPQTIGNWMAQHDEFNEAMKIVNLDAHADAVKRAAFEIATGYEYLGEEVFCHRGVVTRVPVMKHVPPNVAAISKVMKWLAPNDPAFSDEAKLSVSADESFVALWKLVSQGGVDKAQNGSSKPDETGRESAS